MNPSHSPGQDVAKGHARETVAPPAASSMPATQRETIPPGQIDSVAESIPATQQAPAQQFGRYQLIECLGQGAMGSVYKAHDTQLDRTVAIKIPKFDTNDTGLLERFYREARSAATLSHNSICPVFDVGEIDGTHYISMGYIEGKPLSAFIRPDKPLSEKQVVMIVRKLAVALNEAHSKGIVHRDLKPDNVMIGPKSTPVIMDFGLARRSTGADDIRVTHGGQMLGTPAYMSPEQVEGDVNLMGPCSDIYSLGVMFYELLTGRLPYEGTVASVLAQIMKAEPRPPLQLRADLNPELQAMCLKMMAAQPDARYASMADIARDLGRFLKGEATSVRDTVTPAAAAPEAAAAPAPTANVVPQDPGLSGLFTITESQVGESPPASVAAKAAARSKGLPKWAFPAGLAAAAVVILLGVYTLFVKVGDQTVRIEIDDADAQVFVDGSEVRIENLGGTIQLKPGEYGVEVKRGDIVVDARSFQVVKGDNPVLKLEVLTEKPGDGTATATATTTEPPDVASLELSDDLPAAYRNSTRPEVRALGWLLDRRASARLRLDERTEKSASEFRDAPPVVPFQISQLNSSDGLKGDDWKVVRAMPRLKHAHLYGPDFDDAALKHLAGHPSLTGVMLMYTAVTDEGLASLATMPELQTVTVMCRGNQKTSDKAMPHLARIPKLVNLQLKYCDITDEGLAQFAATKCAVDTLQIVNTQGVTGSGVASLRALPKLRDLNLTGTAISDATTSGLSALTQLQTLKLPETQISDGTLRTISALPNLATLDLQQTKITDAGLGHLKGMSRLRYLSLNGTRVTRSAVEAFQRERPATKVTIKSYAAEAPSETPQANAGDRPAHVPPRFAESDDPLLRAVGWALSHGIGLSVNPESRPGSGMQVMDFKTLPDEPFKVTGLRPTDAMPTDFTDADWGHVDTLLRDVVEVRCLTRRFPDRLMSKLVEVQKLGRLHIEEDGLSDHAFELLSQLTKMSLIVIGDPNKANSVTLSAERMASLASLKSDRPLSLQVVNCSISDSAMAALSRSQSISVLYMGNCRLPPAGLEHLSQMRLQFLNLTNTPLAGASVSSLGRITGLGALILKNTGVGDDAVKLAAGLPNLRQLDLADTRVTDAELSGLTDLARLFSLVLNGTQISDEGLQKLESFKTLKHLGIESTHCTQAGADAFKAAVPGCNVSYSRSTDTTSAVESPAESTVQGEQKLQDERPGLAVM